MTHQTHQDYLVHTVVQHFVTERMPELMGMNVQADLLSHRRYVSLDCARTDAALTLGDEKCGVVVITALLQVIRNGQESYQIDDYHSGFASLSTNFGSTFCLLLAVFVYVFVNGD
jgi:hypothetical protein